MHSKVSDGKLHLMESVLFWVTPSNQTVRVTFLPADTEGFGLEKSNLHRFVFETDGKILKTFQVGLFLLKRNSLILGEGLVLNADNCQTLKTWWLEKFDDLQNSSAK